MSESNNYYEQKDHATSERVVLAEDVNIDIYKDYKAKFYIPALTPLLKKTSPYKRKKPAPSTKMQRRPLKTATYYESNFIVLTIPRSIVLQFVKKIPKKTEFTAQFVGGEVEVGKLKIDSVYKYNGNQVKDEEIVRTPKNKKNRTAYIRLYKNRPQWSNDKKHWHYFITVKSDRSTYSRYTTYIGRESHYYTAENLEDIIDDIYRRINENRDNIIRVDNKVDKNIKDIDTNAKDIKELQQRVDELSNAIANLNKSRGDNQ